MACRAAVLVLAALPAIAGCGCGRMGFAPDTGPGSDGGGIDAPVDAPLDAPRDAPDAPFDAPWPDNTCASVRVGTSRVIPTVLLVIDQSGSMNLELDGGSSRWTVLRSALIRMPGGLVYDLRTQVRFGAVMYTEDPEVGAGCPDVRRRPAVLDGWDEISAFYSGVGPGGNTPTGDTLRGVLTDIDTLAPERAEGPTIIVLATDGEPATCEDGTDVVGGRALVVDQVTMAHAMGIDTYVISVGNEIGAMHLQDVANAGLGRAPSDPDAPFWVATDTTGLESALRTIVGGVVSCHLELAGEIEPAFACDGTVTLGGDELECGTEWRATDGTHIEVLGAACDRLIEGDVELIATFPCDVLI